MSDGGREPRIRRRLPAGRHGLTRDQVAENQRLRMIMAAAETLAARGCKGVTAREISSRAGVSSTSFYQQFDNVDACLLAAHGMVADCVWELASAACAGAGGWPERLRACVDAVAGFLAAEPFLARLLCADLAAGVPAVSAAREQLLGRLARLLYPGRALCPEAGALLPVELEIHLAGGAIAVAGQAIAAGEVKQLDEMSPELAELLSRPYTAPAAA